MDYTSNNSQASIAIVRGHYKESLAFCGADVILRSSDPQNRDVVASTIIDGGSRGSVISLRGTETEECVIAGLTILNGRAGVGGGICGGYYKIPGDVYPNSHAAIRNNLIKGNSAAWQGGGVAFCDGTIENNVILCNSALSSTGGGLHGCDGVIRNNVVSGNSAGLGGGGLCICGGTIRGNLITGNVAQGGGGLHECDGGTLDSNTVCANSATLVGGGMNTCNGTILNCVVWGNTAPEDPEISWSSAPGYSRVGGADPGFVDADGADNNPTTWEDNDYHLASGSPCIDKGKNEDWMWDAVNLDGKERIIDGDEDGSAVVDMGAYEYRFVLRVLEATTTPEGGLELIWNSRPGDSYIISICPDLSTWVWISVATVPSQGLSTTWTDPDITLTRKMFYRIQID